MFTNISKIASDPDNVDHMMIYERPNPQNTMTQIVNSNNIFLAHTYTDTHKHTNSTAKTLVVCYLHVVQYWYLDGVS